MTVKELIERLNLMLEIEAIDENANIVFDAADECTDNYFDVEDITHWGGHLIVLHPYKIDWETGLYVKDIKEDK